MNFLKIFIITVLIKNVAYSHELETFIQDNSFYLKKTINLVFENSYHFHDIEDDVNNLEYEYENFLTSIGMQYSLSDKDLLRISHSTAYSVTNSHEKTFFNDPILSYWRRVSASKYEGDLDHDVGLEYIPLLSAKYSKQSWHGNTIVFKYRFGIQDKKNNIHASYFLGMKEGRSFSENGENRKVSSAVYYGLNFVYEYLRNKKYSLGVKLDVRKSSEHSGTAYFQNSEFTSSWTAEYNLFITYKLNKTYQIIANYLASDEATKANKLKRSRDLDVEEKRILLALKFNNL